MGRVFSPNNRAHSPSSNTWEANPYYAETYTERSVIREASVEAYCMGKVRARSPGYIERTMLKTRLSLRLTFLTVSLVQSVFAVNGEAGQANVVSHRAEADQVAVSSEDIGGTVSGPKGPEAGVWVIAETSDLPTVFRKIVVTDEKGRFLVPDLPKANYNVWVRGYGLIDSAAVKG